MKTVSSRCNLKHQSFDKLTVCLGTSPKQRYNYCLSLPYFTPSSAIIQAVKHHKISDIKDRYQNETFLKMISELMTRMVFSNSRTVAITKLSKHRDFYDLVKFLKEHIDQIVLEEKYFDFKIRSDDKMLLKKIYKLIVKTFPVCNYNVTLYDYSVIKEMNNLQNEFPVTVSDVDGFSYLVHTKYFWPSRFEKQLANFFANDEYKFSKSFAKYHDVRYRKQSTKIYVKSKNSLAVLLLAMGSVVSSIYEIRQVNK